MPPVDSSSEGLDTGVTAESPTATQDVAAESSTADEGVKAPASPLEAVKAALEATSNENATETAPKGDKATESPTREAEAKDEKSSTADQPPHDQEDKSFSKEANRRIRTLVAERNEARQAIETSKQEVETYRQRAEAYDTISAKVRETGASAEQIDQAVALLGLLNKDPAAAFEVLTPVYQSLERFVGNRLPDDLQEKVDGGYLDMESAKEIQRLRSANQFGRQQQQQSQRQTEQERQDEAVSTLKASIHKATSDWETDWKKNDPDHQRKMPFVMSEIKARMAEAGGITSAAQAVKIAGEALDAVNERLSGLMPPKQEIKTVTGGAVQPNSMPKPRSALEVVSNALRA